MTYYNTTLSTGAQLNVLPNKRPNLDLRALSWTFAPYEKKYNTGLYFQLNIVFYGSKSFNNNLFLFYKNIIIKKKMP